MGISELIFFLISGYVFAYVYLLEKKTTLGKEFFLNRFARLYPLHFLTLLLVLLIQLYSLNSFNTFLINTNNDFYHFILHLFFALASMENPNKVSNKVPLQSSLKFYRWVPLQPQRPTTGWFHSECGTRRRSCRTQHLHRESTLVFVFRFL